MLMRYIYILRFVRVCSDTYPTIVRIVCIDVEKVAFFLKIEKIIIIFFFLVDIFILIIIINFFLLLYVIRPISNTDPSFKRYYLHTSQKKYYIHKYYIHRIKRTTTTVSIKLKKEHIHIQKSCQAYVKAMS